MPPFNPLRPVTHRLNTTAVEDLPHYVSFLARSIQSCDERFWQAEFRQDDDSVQIHKLRTKISSLLQDNTKPGRFAGVVLAKAVVDVAGADFLTTSGGWVRSLLSCLKRSDAPEVRRLTIITITRIFLVTKDHPSLVREVTTPALPAFITATLSLVTDLVCEESDRSAAKLLLYPILNSWLELISEFPATFRPSLPMIKPIILRLLSNDEIPQQVKNVSARLFVSFHICAPRNTASSEWSQICQQVIEAAHQNANLIFRSVVEEWKSTGQRTRTTATGGKVFNKLCLKDLDAAGLNSWTGMSAGCSRVVHLLQLLSYATTEKHAQVVPIPLSEILDLTARLTAVATPGTDFTLVANPDIGNDERTDLWMNILRIHEAVFNLFAVIGQTFGQTMRPVSQIMLSQIWNVLDVEGYHAGVRNASYRALNVLMSICGCKINSTDIQSLENAVFRCCSDLKSRLRSEHAESLAKLSPGFSVNPKQHSGLEKANQGSTDVIEPEFHHEARSFIVSLLSHAPHMLSASMRAQIDGVLVLLRYEQGMLASVLNPPIGSNKKYATSILPFLARAHENMLSIEGLLRPRMPVIWGSGGKSPDFQSAEDSKNEQGMEDGAETESVAMATKTSNSPQAAAVEQSTSEAIPQVLDLPRKRGFGVMDQEFMNAEDEIAAMKRPREAASVDESGATSAAPMEAKTHNASGQHGTTTVNGETPATNNTAESPVDAMVEDAPMSVASAASVDMAWPVHAGRLATASDTFARPRQDSDDEDEEIPTIDTTAFDDSMDDSDAGEI